MLNQIIISHVCCTYFVNGYWAGSDNKIQGLLTLRSLHIEQLWDVRPLGITKPATATTRMAGVNVIAIWRLAMSVCHIRHHIRTNISGWKKLMLLGRLFNCLNQYINQAFCGFEMIFTLQSWFTFSQRDIWWCRGWSIKWQGRPMLDKGKWQ